jgi:hypothetical protein
MTHLLPDGRDADLLDHPFDQYQRYQDIRLVVDIMRAQEHRSVLRILDVGGTSLSQRFLPADQVTTANLTRDESLQVQTDGSRLALADASFDVVITVDTLEHVPAPRRAAFLAELRRVARGYIVLTGPFANGYNETAERLLSDYLTNVAGVHHRYLNEHLQNGLPDTAETRHALGPDHQTLTIPSGYIQHWLPLMIIKHELQRVAGGQAITDDLDRFYNHQAYWRDHQLPSYRQLIVAAKSDRPAVLDAIQAAFETQTTAQSPDLNGVFAMWQALRWNQVLRDQAADSQQLHAHAAQQTAELTRLQAENQRLSQLVRAYENGRFIRWVAALKRALGVRR